MATVLLLTNKYSGISQVNLPLSQLTKPKDIGSTAIDLNLSWKEQFQDTYLRILEL